MALYLLPPVHSALSAGIRPKMVVSALKELAERERIESPGREYDRLFSEQIADYGRISELPLIAEFLLSYPQGVFSLWRWAWSFSPGEDHPGKGAGQEKR